MEKLLPWRRPLTGIPGSRQESDSIFTPENHITQAQILESRGWVHVCFWGNYRSKTCCLQVIQCLSTKHFYQSISQPYFHIWCWSLLQSGCCLWWTTGTGRWTWKSGNEVLGCRGIHQSGETRQRGHPWFPVCHSWPQSGTWTDTQKNKQNMHNNLTNTR